MLNLGGHEISAMTVQDDCIRFKASTRFSQAKFLLSSITSSCKTTTPGLSMDYEGACDL